MMYIEYKITADERWLTEINFNVEVERDSEGTWTIKDLCSLSIIIWFTKQEGVESFYGLDEEKLILEKVIKPWIENPTYEPAWRAACDREYERQQEDN